MSQMSKAKKMKFLSIDVQYRDGEDLKSILERIGNLALMGVQSYKQKENNFSFEYQINLLLDADIDFRIENQDDKTLLIIQSKMNRDEQSTK